MSRCYICDTYIETPRIDPKTGKMRHCSGCDEHIQDALGDFETDETDNQLTFDWGALEEN
jgi:hypothetical protein